jgi:polyisoprenoid-binding protein YceI
MNKIFGLSLLLMFFISANSVSAQAKSWELDDAHANIYFSIDHIFAKIHGRFDDFSAKIDFDPEDLAASSFFFEVEVDSINTSNAKRDKHLRSADFFNGSDFPVIQFQSNSITATGTNTYDVAGTLTMKGKEYDFILPLTLAGIQDHPAMKGTKVAGFNGEVSIDRLAYGVGNGKFYKMGVVGKDVDLLVTLEVLSK